MLGRPFLRLGSSLANMEWICVILITVGLRKGRGRCLCIYNERDVDLGCYGSTSLIAMSFELSENRSRVGESASQS